MKYIGDLWAEGEETILVAEQVLVDAPGIVSARTKIISKEWDIRLDIVGLSPVVKELQVL